MAPILFRLGLSTKKYSVMSSHILKTVTRQQSQSNDFILNLFNLRPVNHYQQKRSSPKPPVHFCRLQNFLRCQPVPHLGVTGMDEPSEPGAAEQPKSHNEYAGVNQAEFEANPKTASPRRTASDVRLCPVGHPMMTLTNKPAYYRGDPYCDTCRTRIYRRFIHCNICSYDLCDRCDIRPHVSRNQQHVHFNNNGLRSLPTNATVHLPPLQDCVCPKGHEMVTLDQKPFEYKGEPFCNVCDIQLNRTFKHCARCAYDLCRNCATMNENTSSTTCERGHEMRLFKKLPPGFSYWVGGVRCDGCRSVVDDPGTGFRHCSTCSYDLCSSCCRARAQVCNINLKAGLK